ncbi:MAG: hypothetical protein QT12_C0031G0009 [archaeon GW2011_AR21]|nr:MAG: hypothetical protein QT12_C0031G0009 [archaeon GW2011_AR21]
MKKIIFAAIIALLLGLSSANAITQQEISEAKGLIDSKVDCKELSDSQLEIMGEYYMEQMHPGESHELMHKMMGFQEGSEDEEQFHINLAKIMYCGEGGMMGSGGMMPMMNMMGSGLISGQSPAQASMMQGMMGNYGYFGYWDLLSILYIILLIGLIVLVYVWIVKSWKDLEGKGGKR